jgi:FtsP/CotA-like multicopper oxidase with cupredoxin domain
MQGNPAQEWIANGTAALPFVAGALWLAGRRAESEPRVRGEVLRAILYAAAMGAAALFTSPVAASTHDGTSTLQTLVQHLGIALATAAAFSLLVDRLEFALDATASRSEWRLARIPVVSKVLVPLICLAVLGPALLVMGAERAAAQTAFPDQAIHPKGSLLLIAKNPGDGTMAFVAPDYGTLGLRPTIEMFEGETLNITLKNELNVDVSLHVHGVDYNQDSDGTRHSGSFVRPGQQRVYQWRARAGTTGYWHYHDHVVGDDEGSTGILSGLYGGLVVRKASDPKPTKTFVIVGHDKTLNGRIFPDTPTYRAKQGDLVEWIVVSHGNRVHTFHLHGHRWLTPARPGDPNPAASQNQGSGREDNHILSPGDSFGFMIIAGEGVGPGKWMYHCHFQDHASAMKGFFEVLPAAGGGEQPPPQTARTFPETGKTISGRFLEYWSANGGLAQQGFPISEEFQERSDLDGKTYKVQYFERAVFEHHPENPAPYDVLLSQLGSFRYKQKYPNGR